MHCLSVGAMDLLERCDGERSPEEVVAYIPSDRRATALACLRELMQAGLVQAAGKPVRNTRIEEVMS